MYYPKLAWNRSPAKERNRNRSCLGWWPISFLVFLIPLRDRDLQSKAQACCCPGTCVQGQQEPQVRAESMREPSGRELKHTVCFFAFQSLILFPVFVILKLKTFGWCARQQKQQTLQVATTPPLMPCQGKAIKIPATLENHARVWARHQLHLSHYTWWVFGLFQSLRKINLNKTPRNKEELL